MKFSETDLKGVVQISLVPHEDDRGFFARSYCARTRPGNQAFQGRGRTAHACAHRGVALSLDARAPRRNCSR